MQSSNSPAPTAFWLWRRLRQQWRAGMLSLMVYACVLAVVCILFGQWTAQSLNHQFRVSGANALGGDRVLSSAREWQGPWWQQVQDLALQQSHSVVFHTMAYVDEQMELVRVRATDGQFPVRGVWQRQPDLPLAPGQIWLAPPAIERLGVGIGDWIELGDHKLKVTGISQSEPSVRGPGFWYAPSVVIHRDDLDAIGAVGPGSRVRYQVLLGGEAQNLSQLDELAQTIPIGGRYYSSEQPEGRGQDWLEYADKMIQLSVCAIILLCFYTLLVAVKGYLLAQRRLLVVYRTFGAQRRHCLWLIYQPLIVSLFGAGLAGALIAGATFALATQLWPQWLSLNWTMLGSLYWVLLPVLMTSLLAYPGAKNLLGVAPRRLLSASIPAQAMTALWLLVSAVVVVWLLGDKQWALWLIGALALVWLTASVLRRVLVKGLGFLPWTHVSWRLALLRLRQHGNTSDTMLVGLILALGLSASVWVLQQRLVQQWLSSLAVDAPNYFLINMEPALQQDIWQLADASSVRLSPPFEIIRGRLTAVNGEPLCTHQCQPDQPQAPGRELNFTYSDTLPQTNEVVAGQWLTEVEGPSVSVEQGFAERTQIELGDQLSFNIYGSDLTFPVSSIRTLDWRSMQPNFFVIFSPQALADYPGMVMASAHLPAGSEDFLPALRQIDSGVTAIDMSRWLTQARQLLDQLAIAVRVIALLLVFAAALLLSSQLMMSLSQRRKEVAVMRLLGATHQQLRRSLILELALLGSVSSLIALLMSEVLAVGLGQLFELAWLPSWLGWAVLLISGPAVVVLAALGFIARLSHGRGWQVQAEYD